MSSTNDQDRKKVLSLSGRGTLGLKRPADGTSQVRQSFPHGRSKTVTVEVRKRRGTAPGAPAVPEGTAEPGERMSARGVLGSRALTAEERAARTRALQGVAHGEEEGRIVAPAGEAPGEETAERAARAAEPEAPVLDRRSAELEEARRIAEAEAAKAAADAARLAEEDQARLAKAAAERAAARMPAAPAAPGAPAARRAEEEEAPRGRRRPDMPARKVAQPRKTDEQRRRGGKLTISQALDDTERARSLASVRRAREREKQRMRADQLDQQKVVREVIIPETITVGELANRMAERGADVIKALMRMGVMATINQTIDADTAELVATEFGHKIKRVSEADVEIGLKGEEDLAELRRPRPPVVTVMGHVDHGKTSLLDALRKTDVAAHEAGGITQHIGAYQVALPSGNRITFIDTPGHEAFTEMRARGANVTDIVVLVVAADDGIMAQTVEAIRHARAAKVPVIVAVNKIDKPGAEPQRVRTELLQHEIVPEEMGGDVQCIDVSAKEGTNLDKLEEAILLQAEVLELSANPDRTAEGTIIEARLERGRGSVATVLVQRGTLKVGDIFVAGAEWGRVRALMDDRGQAVESAVPGSPVEVLGFNGTPFAGDDFIVVDSEARAREVVDYRQRLARDKQAAGAARGTVEQMLSKIAAGEVRELPLVVKADVHGSVEAIRGAIEKLSTDQVGTRVLHAAVGGINESDITLAKATGALVIGFNVRANPQARELARQEKIEIRYYSIIYQVIDDIRSALEGMLAPELRERFLGNAEIRQVFEVTKVGKVAGCRVTEGVVRRGAKVRLLRDNVVIHEGTLKTLRRFKDEVREVQSGFECGMAFENYQDIREGDVIECFELEEVARTLERAG